MDTPPCNLIMADKTTIILQRRSYYFLIITKRFPEPKVEPVVFKIQKELHHMISPYDVAL